MWSRFFLFALSCAFLGLPVTGGAAELSNLFTVAVPVVDQSEAARALAQVDAFKAVLVKVSGSSAVLSLPGVADNLGKASAYIQRYQYAQFTASSVSGSVTSLRLQCAFDPLAVERLLQDSGAPIWGARRPLTLAWLVVNDGKTRRIVGSDDDADLTREWSDAMQLRGVPVQLPAVDTDLRNQLQVSDVYGRFIEPLQAPSKQYGADALLVGRLEKTANGWSGQFALALGTLRKSISADGNTRAQVVQNIVEQLAEIYAQKYALVIDASKEAVLQVNISNVQNVDDYAAVTALFQGMRSVRSADVDVIINDMLKLSLRVIATRDIVEQAIALDARLLPIGDHTGEAMEYRWQP